MLTADTIDPFKRKSKIFCSRCSISYSARDYKILYENGKLAFFKAKFPTQKRKKIYCHYCLYKRAKEEMGEVDKLEMIMRTLESEELIITFYKE
jgi:hypothetical protein